MSTDLLVVGTVDLLNSSMTKKLEELFDLETPVEEKQPDSEIAKTDAKKLQNIMSDVDKIDSALPMVRDLEANDLEMDSIATKAVDTFNDLMDLGMNVEARYAGKIFEVAGTMMKNAIDARAAKIDKKLRMCNKLIFIIFSGGVTKSFSSCKIQARNFHMNHLKCY